MSDKRKIIERCIDILTEKLESRIILRLEEYSDHYKLTPEDKEFINIMCQRHLLPKFEITMGDIELLVKDFKFLLHKEKGVDLPRD